MRSEEIVLSFIAAINRKDLIAMSTIMHEQHEFIDSTGEVLSGCVPVLAAWEEFFQMMPDYQLEVERILADGPVVAVFGITRGTLMAVGGSRPVRRIVIHAAWKAVITDEKLGSWQVYADWSRGLALVQDSEEQPLEGGTLLKT